MFVGHRARQGHLSAAEGKPEMAGVGLGDGVHGEAAGLGGDAGQGSGVLAGGGLHAKADGGLAGHDGGVNRGAGAGDAGLGDKSRGGSEGAGPAKGEGRTQDRLAEHP